VSDTLTLRRAVTGLLSFAAAEEQALLAAAAFCPDYDRGSPDRWAAVPVVAHNNQFKSQQTERILAIRSGQLPAVYGEVDHSSTEVYQDYSAHLGDYYLAHSQPGRAVALQAQGLAMARYLGAPAPAAGMAGYSLACAQAQAGQPEAAARTLAEAIEATPTCGPTPAGIPTCGCCGKLSPKDEPAGSLACSGRRRKEFCVPCHLPSRRTGHADWQLR